MQPAVANQKESDEDFPGIQSLKNPPCNAGVWIQTLVRELRSHTAEQVNPSACLNPSWILQLALLAYIRPSDI